MTQAQKSRNNAALLSFVASFLVLTLKTVGYFQTHSAAILSDAVESIVNVITSIIALYVIWYVSQPADEDHPYGHGKAEYFSAAFEGGLIFFASIWIVLESIKSLIMGSEAHSLQDGIVWIAGATVINLAVGFYLKSTGNKTNSEALKASGLHLLSDVYTTVGVIIGLGLVLLTGWVWIDSLIAIGIGLMLTRESFNIVKKALGALIDEQDDEVLDLLSKSLNQNRVPGIIDIHHMRAIRAGSFHHVDAHLVVPEFWSVAHVHEITHEFENNVVQSYAFDGEIAFHLDPCKKNYCQSCRLVNCPLRQVEFVNEEPFKKEILVKGPKEFNGSISSSKN